MKKSVIQSIGFKIIVFYIFLSLVTISFILSIIFENQIELITQNKTLQSEKKITQLITSIKNFTLEAGEGSLFDTNNNNLLSIFTDTISQHYDEFIIFKEDGSILFSPDSVSLPEDASKEASRALAEKTFTGKEYLMRIDEKKDEINFFIPISDFRVLNSDGILLFIREHTDEVHTTLNNLYKQAIYVVIVIFVFHVIFAVILYRSLIYPLNVLSKMTKRLSNGQFKSKVSFLNRKDEIGILAVAFNDMANAISSNIDSLKHEVKTAHFIAEVAEKIATRDVITDLVNINYLTERINEGITLASLKKINLSLLVIKLGNFHEMNKIYGKQNNNILLVETAKRIKALCPTDIVSRSRWNEFAIFFTNMTYEYIYKIAKELKQTIEDDQIITPDGSFKLTVSIGAVHYSSDQVHLLNDYNDMLNRTTTALESAEKNGADKIEIFS